VTRCLLRSSAIALAELALLLQGSYVVGESMNGVRSPPPPQEMWISDQIHVALLSGNVGQSSTKIN
jgi:hypothetical protein